MGVFALRLALLPGLRRFGAADMTVTGAVVIALVLGPTAWLVHRGERAAGLHEPSTNLPPPGNAPPSPRDHRLPSAHVSGPLRRPRDAPTRAGSRRSHEETRLPRIEQYVLIGDMQNQRLTSAMTGRSIGVCLPLLRLAARSRPCYGSEKHAWRIAAPPTRRAQQQCRAPLPR
ncbi:hypothetical protein GCM10023238_26820 [Streptomyces heliomycini]